MSKPTGTLSYLSLTLSQLAEHFGPNDLIDVRRVQLEKQMVKKLTANFSSPQKAAETPEPSFVVTNFDTPEE